MTASGKPGPPIRRAMDAYDIEVTSVELIADAWNRTYRVDTADGARYALREYRPDQRTDAEISVELQWLRAIGSGELIKAPLPVPTRNGELLHRIDAGLSRTSRRVALFAWVPGTQLGTDPDPSFVRKLGEIVARLHRHGLSFVEVDGLIRADEVCHSATFDPLFDDVNADIVSSPSRSVFERARHATVEAFKRLRASGEPPRIVHGDVHEENVHVDGDDVWLLDFDDCLLAWPTFDLGVTMWEVGEEEADWSYRGALCEGYQQVEDRPERTAGEIDVFAATRGLRKVTRIVQERTGDETADVVASVERHAIAIDWFLDRARSGA